MISSLGHHLTRFRQEEDEVAVYIIWRLKLHHVRLYATTHRTIKECLSY